MPKTPSVPAAVSIPDVGGSGLGGSGGVGDKVGKIADDTGAISDKLDITDEDLKYLRDIAEQEAINRFTTAEIRIDMGGINNTVNERSDLDGIVGYLEEKLYESMSVAAEMA